MDFEDEGGFLMVVLAMTKVDGEGGKLYEIHIFV